MRPTWIVMGLVVGIGAVAYVRLREQAREATGGAPLVRTAAGPAVLAATNDANRGGVPAGAPAAETASDRDGGAPPLSKPAASAASTGSGDVAASSEGVAPGEPAPGEAEAADVRAKLDARRRAVDLAGAEALEKQLDTAYADTLNARRFALERGLGLVKDAMRDDRPLDGRVPIADRARRDLSRGLMLPELFDGAGKPLDARRTLITTIASLNAVVMTYRVPVPGVTTTYDVKPGDSPVRIVSRQKLPYGPNVLLFWNHGGNLDPARLRAGEVLVVPTETLEARVDRTRHLLGLYLGGVLVKEFEVGVGKAATPTYAGVYEVKDKYLNPDWHVPPELAVPGQPRVIPYGDPRNELGDAWIPISSTDHPTGYGIHGTTRPDTVGTDCSNGCVRLRNPEAVEMTNWLRTAKGEGAASRVIIK